ncbi:hypothetical protein ACSBR1_027162 [Camellia fascicularis]
MKCARFVSIPVFSVFLVLGFVYYITIFVFLEDWLGLQSSAGSLNALIFTYLASFSLFSFLVCVLTDPGGVPSAYVPDVEDTELSDQDSKRTVVLVSCTVQKDWNFTGMVSLKIFYIISGVMIVGLSLTLGTLLGWHIYLIIHNMTTIEYYEATRAAWLARKSGQSYRHPYNVGVYKNITLVLGPNMLNWLCPTAVNHIKDGITFPTIRDSS